MPDTATVQITMPEMGESVTEGIVLEWHVAVGDFVNEGDTVVEVSTDKVDAEVPAPTSGTITKLLAEVDDEVPVGRAAGRDGAPGARALPAAGPAAETPSSSQAAGEATHRATRGACGAVNGGNGSGNGADVKATPIARRMAEAQGIDLGLGHAHRLRRQGHQRGRAQRRERLRQRRRAAVAGEEKQLRGPAAMLAKAMDESRAVPTATSFRTIAVDTLDAKRKAINAQLKERGLKTSFTHLVAWAIVEAAKDDPGDGPLLRGARRQALRDRERPGQPRHRRRRDHAKTARTASWSRRSRAPRTSTSRASTRASKT